MDRELAFAPAYRLRELVLKREVSPVELTELYFQRIEELDPQLNSYLTLNREEALATARRAEQAALKGEDLGPLHGVPVSVKDLELTRGLRTTSGSLGFKDRVPEEDSVVVERVRRAGAIILGKTNTPEFGLRGSTENRLGEPCRNPWDPQRTTGGSSGGAGAALVAGLCALATGSDGGGSIRIPASFCGCYGIKPTQGRVPRYGGAGLPPLANHFSQSGPMSRTVRDSAILLQVMAGYDPRDPSSLREPTPDFVAALDRDMRGLRVAWSPDMGYAAVDPEVVETCRRAVEVFEELGCHVEEADDLALDEPFEAFWTIFSATAYAAYGQILQTQAHQLTWYALEALKRGRDVTGADYARALGYIDRLRAQFTELFDRYDLLVTPTMAVTAFPIGHPPREIAGRRVHPFWGYLPFTYPINMVGFTAASIPCGWSSEGLPIGLHIIGGRGDEATVLAASAAFERARPWADRRPPIS